MPYMRSHFPVLDSKIFRYAISNSPVIILLAGLFYPLVTVVLNRWTLTGFYEESIGYRYFYTLRQIYDGNPYVFLPQGQLMDLGHQFIQIWLTILGHPPSELFPRIDLFSYTSLALAYVIIAIAFSSLLAHLETIPGRLLAAVWFLIPYYSHGIDGSYVVLQPDYHNWILPASLAVVTVFTCWDVHSGTAWSKGHAALLAGFAALCIAVKPTLAIYAVSVALAWLIGRPRFWNSVAMCALSAILAILAYPLILLLYYHANLSYVESFLKDQHLFLSSASQQSVAYSSWILLNARTLWLVAAVVLLPFALALTLCTVRDRRKVGPLLAVRG